jgi:hypothetical protein
VLHIPTNSGACVLPILGHKYVHTDGGMNGHTYVHTYGTCIRVYVQYTHHVDPIA